MLLQQELTQKIIGSLIEVHRELGPGLLESAYEECVAWELSSNGVNVRRQVALPLQYKGLRLDCGYRIDLVVDDVVIVELKCVDSLAPIHSAQLMTYMRLSRRRVGLLVNFNVPVLKDGIIRRVL